MFMKNQASPVSNLSPTKHIYTAGEYKYQIGCQVNYDPNNPETPLFIMELERVVRNLPQTLTGETPKAMPTRTKVRGVLPTPSTLSDDQSLLITLCALSPSGSQY